MWHRHWAGTASRPDGKAIMICVHVIKKEPRKTLGKRLCLQPRRYSADWKTRLGWGPKKFKVTSRQDAKETNDGPLAAFNRPGLGPPRGENPSRDPFPAARPQEALGESG